MNLCTIRRRFNKANFLRTRRDITKKRIRTQLPITFCSSPVTFNIPISTGIIISSNIRTHITRNSNSSSNNNRRKYLRTNGCKSKETYPSQLQRKQILM